MVNRCSNHDCRAEFKVLNGGNLYALERKSADTEFFWLCSACTSVFELYLDPAGCVSVRAQSPMHRSSPPHPEGNLRCISRYIQPALRPNTMPSGERSSTFASIDEPFSAAFRMRGLAS